MVPKLPMAAACSLQLPPIILQKLYDITDFHGTIKLKVRRITADSCTMAKYPSSYILRFELNLTIRVAPQTETLHKCIFAPVSRVNGKIKVTVTVIQMGCSTNRGSAANYGHAQIYLPLRRRPRINRLKVITLRPHSFLHFFKHFVVQLRCHRWNDGLDRPRAEHVGAKLGLACARHVPVMGSTRN